MPFEWDQAKNASNRAKHGIDFRDATALFDAPRLERVDDRRDYGETRWITIGTLGRRVLVVVYARRAAVIRIISVRRASSHERKLFEASIGDEATRNLD